MSHFIAFLAQRSTALVGLAVVLLPLALTATAGPTPQWVKDGLVIEHPGKIRVEYLGQFQDRPPRYLVQFDGETFTMFDGAIGPDFHSAQLFEYVQIAPTESVLEIGTGIGTLAVLLARRGNRVVATDIESISVENTKFNAASFGVADLVDARAGDLFAPIRADERFDVILFNVIYPYNEKTHHFWKIHERFFADAQRFLKPGGRIYYQAGYLENLPHIRTMVEANQFHIVDMRMWAVPRYRREPMVFTIRPKLPVPPLQ